MNYFLMNYSFYTQNLSLTSEPIKNRVPASGKDVCRGHSVVLPTLSARPYAELGVGDNTTAGHWVLGRRYKFQVQPITCLSPFPCHVYSTEGYIGPEPPSVMTVRGVCPYLHHSLHGCRGHAGLRVGGTAWLL